jgi:hypothetical protein
MLRGWEVVMVRGRMTDEGRGTMDEKVTNKIKTVRDLKVYVLSSFILAKRSSIGHRLKAKGQTMEKRLNG